MSPRWSRRASALAAAVSLAAVAGCTSEGSDGDGAPPPSPPAQPADFPQPKGQKLAQLRGRIGAGGPVLSPSVSVLEPGENRVGFGLFDRARAQIADAPVALYAAPADGGEVSGPFPARYEALVVKPQFQSRSVAADPDSAKSLYTARVAFPHAGDYELFGAVRLDDRLVATDRIAVRVVEDSPVPEVGEAAPKSHTPTEADVSGDLARIDTRLPPGTMHEVDFADVAGKRPAVLLFATPALCQSRVCGPVVDVAEQVKAAHGDRVAWTHMEIYLENEVERGFRAQVREWSLPTEPWLFAVDRRGRIAARIEGAFSARELEQAVRAALGT